MAKLNTTSGFRSSVKKKIPIKEESPDHGGIWFGNFSDSIYRDHGSKLFW